MSVKARWIAGCSLPILIAGFAIAKVAQSFKPEAKAERVESVSQGDVEIKVVETGTIEPLHKVEIKSKAGGRVLKLFVKEGDRVKRGQVLATIDPQEVNSQVAALRAQLAGAQARLAAAKKTTNYQMAQTNSGILQYRQAVASAQSRLRSAEAESQVQPQMTAQSIVIAKANLEAAKFNLKLQEDAMRMLVETTQPQNIVNSQSEYDRTRAQYENSNRNLTRQKTLLEKGFISQQAVDTAETDRSVADAQLRQAKQRLDRIKATNALEETNAKSQIASARSQVNQMEASLLQAQSSVLPLTKKQELDNARASLAQAQAQLASANSGKTQDAVRGDEAVAAMAAVEQLQKQLDELMVRQNDTTLVASMDGVVTKKYTEEGELITSAISSFSAGTPVYQISDLSVMLVQINVNEVDIHKVQLGLLTEVSIDASKGAPFLGKVSKVAPAAATAAAGSTSSGQTVIRFPVEIQIDKADPRLKPGMSARCTIVVNRVKNALRVAKTCLEGDGATATVVAVTDNPEKDKPAIETKKTITVGVRGDDFVEIKSGLKVGEKLKPAAFTGPKRATIEVNGP